MTSIVTRFILSALAERITEPIPQLEITNLSVINATTNAVIDSDLQDNDSINLSGVPISIKATATDDVSSLIWEIDGVEVHRSNYIHKILPDRIYKGSTGYTILSETRPFHYGIGIRQLTVTPYSGVNGTGTAGTSIDITIEFNNGTPLGITPSTENVSDLTELQNAIAAAADYDTIVIMANINCSGYNPTISDRIKIIGDAQYTLSNIENWNIASGLTFRNLIVTNSNFNNPCFNLQDGVNGVFFGNVTWTSVNRAINANDSPGDPEVRGIVFSNCVGSNFGGSRASVMDIKSKVSNVVAINNTFSDLIATDAASEGFKIGSDQDKYINSDIIWYNNYMETINSLENADREVHGVHAFGSYLYIVGNTVKDILNPNQRADREAIDGAGNNGYIAHNWVHNGGARGQEGHFNFKDEMDGCIYEYNLVTSNRSIDTGQGFVCHGEILFRFNKAVLEFTSDSNGGMLLCPMYDDDESYVHNNQAIINGAKLCRFNIDTPGQDAIVHVFSNIARIKTMEASTVFYKNSAPSDVVILKEGQDSLCPPTGLNGSSCAPEFSGTNWYLNHIPTHDRNGWYPDEM